MAVRKAGRGKGLDSLIPEHSVRRKAEKTEQKPEKNELLLKITDTVSYTHLEEYGMGCMTCTSQQECQRYS